MNTRIVATLFPGMMACAALHADEARGKLSPFVRQAALSPSADVRQAAAGEASTLTAFVLLEGDGADSVMQAHGCRILDRQGSLAIASIPRRSILPLAHAPQVRRIEAGAPCRLQMDTAAVAVQAHPAWTGAALPQAYTGRGVVVGVMDVGFDLTHPNFRSPDLTTCRIGALWDQLSTDTVGSPFHVGRDFIGGEALLALGHSADGLIETHGTHTLGSAAGTGFDSPYRGMAWEADICLVANAVNTNAVLIPETDRYKYTTATDALGFKYIFDHATAQGKPCVASFSEGYSPTYDASDSLFRAYLQGLTGPGRIIMAAAGNESRNDVGTRICKPLGTPEAGAFVAGQRSVSMLIGAKGCPGLRLLDYLGGKDSMDIALSALPLDSTLSIPFVKATGDTSCVATLTRYLPSMAAADTLCLLTLDSTQTLYSRRLALVLTGAGADADARSLSGAGLFHSRTDTDRRWTAWENTRNVLAPACFEGVIAVGATIHRTGFTNYLGEAKDYAQEGRNDGVRSHYSSVGPANDGTVKPEVMAPGSNVISSYSSFYEEHNPTAGDMASDVAHFDFEGRTYAWNSNTGTSMACPVAAGVVALWLQANPTLTPSDVMDVVSHTSRRPEEGLDYPNNLYGHGEINAYAGLLHLLGLTHVEGLSGHQPQDVQIVPRRGGLRLLFTGIPPSELRLAAYTVGGAKAFEATVRTDGRQEVDVALSGCPAGVLAVQVSAGDARCTGSALVRME